MTNPLRPIGATGASPLSPAIEAGSLVFISGQVGTDPATGTAPPGVEDQTRIALDRITALLTTAGLSRDRIVKTTVYLADIREIGTVNAIYREYFAEPFPARTTIAATLPKPELRVEIEAIALR
ncbi:RidA family protein [Phytohabitans sp. ZYX-F-186]|uniref:RidA family protein n=1 Tax=Phytohabitans maris TaxID=3071409 RepID=A0ABU0ZSA4_9ACTN|nr:RidA family protein [Phytohabitans sp. ZYX-F-186]MDQ7909913.1 RidA family protein [Phytohabitans sp. ZYX-F-186]